MDIEAHTVIFLPPRDAGRVRALRHGLPGCWNFEELWHGEAFSRLLGEAGIEVAPDEEHVRYDSLYPSRRARNRWIRRRTGWSR